ncbi:SDR family NAD(P)-dependent oxidoreductase [Actinomadura sp. HBU206391]|uniref:SDR family NAD(P)-dependent oxidoreductase n=1 Tax=Actinomadura sp. HBU206391 TaxID=2731692 RepID=UPI00164FF5A2|nr:SDR family oxidoreductase [Actinomadura sp. HBU206391]MBC6456516.1 SDR family oxidoreductase [Actinomadura sp. HBU206391]
MADPGAREHAPQRAVAGRPARFDFTGRTALVTGAAGGIGGAIAAGLAASGATVWSLDRDDTVRAAADRIGGHTIVGDVRDPGLPEAALSRIGDVDLLVLAAGVQVRTTGSGITEDDWQRLADVNLSGPYRMIRAAVPHLRRRGGGSVLAVSSMSADRAVAGIVPYGATKAALSHLIRGLAVELGEHRIRLNGIAPGYVLTAMTGSLLADEERAARIRERIPLGRPADPEEMVGPSLFLLSDAAAYVTGQILAVDGGYALS